MRFHVDLKAIKAAPESPVEELPEHVLRTGPRPAPIFEGDAVEVELRLNTTGATRGPASISGLIGENGQTFGVGVVPRGGWRRIVPHTAASRGTLTAKSWEITATDSAGFFRTHEKCVDIEVALVFPRFKSSVEPPHARELEASLAAPRAGSGTELFGIREYRAGDSLRRIHWRSSARHGGLVVREFEPPGVRTMGILLEALSRSRDAADQLCRIAASEAWECIRDGGRVVLWGPGLEASLSPTDLWAQLEWLARYPDHASDLSDEAPPGQEEVVVVASQADAALIEAVETARARGSRVRGWIVGDAEIDIDIPIHRVGTAWPL